MKGRVARKIWKSVDQANTEYLIKYDDWCMKHPESANFQSKIRLACSGKPELEYRYTKSQFKKADTLYERYIKRKR